MRAFILICISIFVFSCVTTTSTPVIHQDTDSLFPEAYIYFYGKSSHLFKKDVNVRFHIEHAVPTKEEMRDPGWFYVNRPGLIPIEISVPSNQYVKISLYPGTYWIYYYGKIYKELIIKPTDVGDIYGIHYDPHMKRINIYSPQAHRKFVAWSIFKDDLNNKIPLHSSSITKEVEKLKRAKYNKGYYVGPTIKAGKYRIPHGDGIWTSDKEKSLSSSKYISSPKTYRGTFENGLPTTNGVLHMEEGIYTGHYWTSDDDNVFIPSSGMITTGEEIVYVGEFNNEGKKNGFGTSRDAAGNISIVNYDNGVLVNEETINVKVENEIKKEDEDKLKEIVKEIEVPYIESNEKIDELISDQRKINYDKEMIMECWFLYNLTSTADGGCSEYNSIEDCHTYYHREAIDRKTWKLSDIRAKRGTPWTPQMEADRLHFEVWAEKIKICREWGKYMPGYSDGCVQKKYGQSVEEYWLRSKHAKKYSSCFGPKDSENSTTHLQRIEDIDKNLDMERERNKKIAQDVAKRKALAEQQIKDNQQERIKTKQWKEREKYRIAKEQEEERMRVLCSDSKNRNLCVCVPYFPFTPTSDGSAVCQH